MIKIFKALLVIALLVTIFAAIYLWRPIDPSVDTQALASQSKLYNAEIVRDEWGVPHILGKRNIDTSFGLAYAHAEDDFETIQETVAATRGVMASYRGRSAAPADYLVELLNVWQTIDARYQHDVPEAVSYTHLTLPTICSV